MGKVEIKIFSWLGDSFPGNGVSHAALQESFADGATLLDLLRQLSSRYPRFGEVIFDSGTRRFYPHVNFIYRGKAEEGSRDLDRLLEDGDELIFVPYYAGG